MTDSQIVQLGTQAFTVAAKLGAPVLVTALLLGFAISLFQSVTQIQEATLSFVPKVVGVGVALLFSGNWMVHEMVSYTNNLFQQIPSLINS
jgi:flagellar biosynthetic protein FliQ